MNLLRKRHGAFLWEATASIDIRGLLGATLSTVQALKLVFAAVASLAILCGCANLNTIAAESEAIGTSKTFEHPYDEVAPAALEAAQSLNVNIKTTEKHDDTYRILFTKSVSAWSWGEVGAIYVKPVGPKATQVTVRSDKRDKLQITGTNETNFSDAIFSGIETRLVRK